MIPMEVQAQIEEYMKGKDLSHQEKSHIERFFKGLFAEGGTCDPEDYVYAGGDGGMRNRWMKEPFHMSATQAYVTFRDKSYDELKKSLPRDDVHDELYHIYYRKTKTLKLFPFFEDPIPKDNCVCGVPIIEMCFLYNKVTQKSVGIGNCCVNKYIPNQSTKKCVRCDTPTMYMRNDWICKVCRPAFNKEKENDLYLSYLDLKIRQQDMRHMNNWTWTHKKTGNVYKFIELATTDKNFGRWIVSCPTFPNTKLVEYLNKRFEIDREFEKFSPKAINKFEKRRFSIPW